MHRALYIEEILVQILSHCYTLVCHRWPPRPTVTQCCYANVHLAALARTRKTFKEPALDMIWAELDDLIPLIRCLPETSWVESEGVYSLRKPLETNEWDIITRYAHRVRALPRLLKSSGLAGDCIQALSNPPGFVDSLFPGLRIIGLQEPSTTMALLIPHFINFQLTDISMERVENLGTVIGAFGKGCPLVTNFHVSQWAPTDTTSDLIPHWQNLRYVQCHNVSLSAAALCHLSRLRNLQYASLKVHHAMVDHLPTTRSFTTTGNFSALHNIYLSSDHLNPVSRLLRHFHFAAVHRFSVATHAHSTASDLMSFLVALGEAFMRHESLNHLSLYVYVFGNGSNDPPSGDISPYYLTFDRLLPLAVFVNIQSITLDVLCGADLNESELLSLAASWPHLERFEVGKHYDWTPSSALTPGGFLQLLERCRSLRVFYFMFDTRGFTEIPRGHPWQGLTMREGAFIHVLHSPIEEESIEALGVFFHVAPYPSFGLSSHWNNHYFRGHQPAQELCDMYYDRWVKARSLARDLWEERRDLRRSLETRSS